MDKGITNKIQGKLFWLKRGMGDYKIDVFARGTRMKLTAGGWPRYYTGHSYYEDFSRVTGIKLKPGEQRCFVLKEYKGGVIKNGVGIY